MERIRICGVVWPANSEVPALDIYLAATTSDTTDDYEIIDKFLSGNDLIISAQKMTLPGG